MADRTPEVRAAIITLVKADAGLGALGIEQVYDWRPDVTAGGGDVAPYCAWGGESADAWDTNGVTGSEMLVAIKVHARQRGQIGTLRVMQALRDALHRAPLTLSAGAALTPIFDSSTIATGNDGLTHEGTVIFLIYTHD